MNTKGSVFLFKTVMSILLNKNSTIKYFQNADLNLSAFSFLISSSDNKYFSG